MTTDNKTATAADEELISEAVVVAEKKKPIKPGKRVLLVDGGYIDAEVAEMKNGTLLCINLRHIAVPDGSYYIGINKAKWIGIPMNQVKCVFFLMDNAPTPELITSLNTTVTAVIPEVKEKNIIVPDLQPDEKPVRKKDDLPF